jgi:signal transduction histidine kinase
MTTVLVIEDEAAIRSSLIDLLEIEDFTVIGAANGSIGVQLARENPPDLIICDIMMPSLDGYGVLRELRKNPETTAIPFIFLTARAEPTDFRHGMELGADDYVPKPFSREDLLKAIQTRLARAQSVRTKTEAEFNELKHNISVALAHELRTPTTILLGYTNLATQDISALSLEELQLFLSKINQGTLRISRLVENLLVLVQVDTGQTAEDFRETAKADRAVGDVIARVVKSYQAAAQAHHITLEARLDPDLPTVVVSPVLFMKALGELIDNGIKFSKTPTGNVTVSACRTAASLEIAVIDDGLGIPSDGLPHIFERFRQINRQRQEQQGVGVGLTVARELIRLHGGDIQVASVLGSGSTFTIHLPEGQAT